MPHSDLEDEIRIGNQELDVDLLYLKVQPQLRVEIGTRGRRGALGLRVWGVRDQRTVVDSIPDSPTWSSPPPPTKSTRGMRRTRK